ncbi:hypothetical protein [Flavobacterium aquidurense]|uniref:hypothetical protein n=1 Tax=Flavobacterium aquidurense TaxID=362413 RepID=UPI00285F3939|nr:hypothetical protein [Flavobacterium aquidurense]MDR7370412.1 hypothetical protein [Flavobacterium aquidurense]
MESKLSLSEFRTRLNNNTQIGSPKLRLSPFGAFFSIFDGTSKLFYGLFDDKSFRLTMNSTMSPTFFIIKGKYKITNRRLIINYNIEPSPKFFLAWIKSVPIFGGIVMNLLLIFSENAPMGVFIVVNVFIVFMIFYSRWHTNHKRKNIEKKFIEIFEIVE